MYPKVVFEGSEYSSQWFEKESSRVAAALRDQGVNEGACVAVMMRNCPEYVAIVVACRRAGIYVVSVNWHFKAGEIKHILTDSGSRALFIHWDLFEQAAAGVPSNVTIVGVDRRDVDSEHRVDAPSVRLTALDYSTLGAALAPFNEPVTSTRGAIPYTSGTTGKPKGVSRIAAPLEISKATDERMKRLQSIVFGIGPSSVVLLSAPIYHSAPMSYLVCSCLAGATIVLESSFDAARTLELIERYAVNSIYLVPTMMQRLLRLDGSVRDSRSIGSLRHAISTGSSCSPETKRRMIDWWGPVIFEAYASSETGYITLIGPDESLVRPSSVGRPIGSARVKILADDGHEAPVGVIGQIYAKQPDYPECTYLNNAAAWSAIERDGLVCVGDMGFLDAAGYLYIADRKSDMVISGGVNIYPAEVEALLQGMPGVVDCAVFGIPDDEFGESLAAAVQLRPGATLSVDDVRDFLQERIANYKVPRVFEFHDCLPREDTGKIFKRLLREPFWKNRSRNI